MDLTGEVTLGQCHWRTPRVSGCPIMRTGFRCAENPGHSVAE
jgi:hypothetical protein